MIASVDHDVYLKGEPAEIILDFQQIVACFSKYIRDKAISVNSKVDPDEVVIELFCQSMAAGPENCMSITDVTAFEQAMEEIRKEEDDE